MGDKVFTVVGPSTQVISDVVAERYRQRQKYSAEHDDSHTVMDFTYYALRRLPPIPGGAARQQIIECIAVLVAAVESMDRKEASDG